MLASRLFKYSSNMIVTLTSIVNIMAMITPSLASSWKFSLNDDSGMAWPKPPSWEHKAKMARYLVHYAPWGIVSAISPEMDFVPYGTLQSFCDGPLSNSTGIPYFYMSVMSDTYKNINYNNSVSFSLSMAESEYCAAQGWDPEEPVCARVTLVGKMIPVSDKGEVIFAKQSLFTRHPSMADWPASHGWKFYKLDLQKICLLDYYGGASHITLAEYFGVKL